MIDQQSTATQSTRKISPRRVHDDAIGQCGLRVPIGVR